MDIDTLYERRSNAYSDQESYDLAIQISDYCRDYNCTYDYANYGGWLYRAWQAAPSDYDARQVAGLIANYCRDYGAMIDYKDEQGWREYC